MIETIIGASLAVRGTRSQCQLASIMCDAKQTYYSMARRATWRQKDAVPSVKRPIPNQTEVLRLIPVTSILHVVETMADGKPCIDCEGSPMFDREDCLHVWIDKYRGRPGSIFKPQAFLDHMIVRRDPNRGQALSGYA